MHIGNPSSDRSLAASSAAASRPATSTSFARRWWEIVKTTFSEFSSDNASRLAAALAYYTLFSVAPVLLIGVAVAGAIYGDQAVEGRLHEELSGVLGDDAAGVVQQMVAKASRTGTGILATITGFAALMWGASNVFTQLKNAMDTVWGVESSKESGWLKTIKGRGRSFLMVLGINFMLLLLLVVHTALATAKGWLGDAVPGSVHLFYLAEIGGSLLIVTLLFAMMLKYLPELNIGWRHIWLGALITAILFTAGKYLFGLYIGFRSTGSSYGAAGSVMIILLWAYYFWMIFLLGAEFTQAHAQVIGQYRQKRRRREAQADAEDETQHDKSQPHAEPQ